MEKEGLSVEFGDVAWKISSDFIKRLMIDDLSGLSREVTALHHLCHRYLFPKGFIKKKEREKAASQRFQSGRVINRGAFGRQKWHLSKRAEQFCTCLCVCQGMSTKLNTKHYAWVRLVNHAGPRQALSLFRTVDFPGE